MAKECQALELTEEVLPQGLSVISLPGHSDGQFGIRTDDDVVFLADCLMGQETLDKYRISHIFDVGSYLATLEMVKRLSAALFIPSHAAPCEDIVPLAEANIKNTLDIMNDVEALCGGDGLAFDDPMAALFEKYDLAFNLGQYCLNGCTIKTMLAKLPEEGRIIIAEEEMRIRWRRN